VSGVAVGCWAGPVLVSASQWEDKVRVWDISSHQTIREVKMKGQSQHHLLTLANYGREKITARYEGQLRIF